VDYKNDNEWQLWNHNAKKHILGVDCTVKRVVPREIGRGTPTSSGFLQEEISEPTFVSETQYGDLHASPFVSMASMTASSGMSWRGQEDVNNESKRSAPPTNNNGCKSNYQDTVKNIQKRQHETLEISDDSDLEEGLDNEKVRV
jgi:hypothetical protein